MVSQSLTPSISESWSTGHSRQVARTIDRRIPLLDGVHWPVENYAFADTSATDSGQLQTVNLGGSTPAHESLLFEETFTTIDNIFDQPSHLTGGSFSLNESQGPAAPTVTAAWCTWMRSDISLAIVAEKSSDISDLQPEQVAISRFGRSHAQHNADIIVQALRSFPTMMLRRQTFPWFIHRQSQLLSKQPSTDHNLPTAICTCMSIAQMFVSQTAETRSFLRQMIEAENCRFAAEVPCSFPSICFPLTINKVQYMSGPELLTAMQACMIYLIILMIDYAPGDQGHGQRLLLVLQASLIKQYFRSTLNLYRIFT